MEQTMSKNAKPLLMMKALVLAYAVTGILLLVLAFLLYKLGLGESQVNLGIMVIYILSSLLGSFIWEKGENPKIFMGHGSGRGICLSFDSCNFSHRAPDAGRHERNGAAVFSLHHWGSPGRYAFLKGLKESGKETLAWRYQLCYNTARCILYLKI